MATILEKGTLFPEELIPGLFSKVMGKSSIAKLAAQQPVSFVGNEVMTFSMDDEVALVAESAAKSAGNVTIAPVKIVPVKIEYGFRVSDEFLYASDEKRLDILRAFVDGFAKKAARGLDIMAMHGVNPRTGQASSLIQSYLDQVTKTVTYTPAKPDDNVEAAVALLGDRDLTGIAMSRTMAADMAKLQDAAGAPLYRELRWGGQPNTVNGVETSINSTVHHGSSTDQAIVGDFQNYFKWGYSKQIPMEIIPYGDPDNTGADLKGHNQVYLRCEAYLGWAVLDKAAFVRIID